MKPKFLILLLSFIVHLSFSQTFYDNGVAYKITSSTTVEVTGNYTYSGGTITFATNNYAGHISVPDSVKYLTNFYQVTGIGTNAFDYCSNLDSVSLPNSITYIGSSAFLFCSDLAYVKLPDSLNSILGKAFSGCSGLTSFDIPNTVTYIGERAFYGCSGLTSLTIPNAIDTLYNTTFAECSGLKSIILPDSLITIEDHAFNRCSSLTTITLPSSIQSIGNYTFYKCSSLTSIISKATAVPILGTAVFSNINSSATLCVPSESLNAYQSALQWGDFNVNSSCFSITKNTNLSREIISIYPNPASETLIISGVLEAEKIIIFSANGQTKETLEINSPIQSIDVSDWSTGLYFVTIVNSAGVFDLSKFVITK